jgi:hypothetical protein
MTLTARENAGLLMDAFAPRLLQLRQPGATYAGHEELGEDTRVQRYRIRFTRGQGTGALTVALVYDAGDELTRIDFAGGTNEATKRSLHDRGASFAATRVLRMVKAGVAEPDVQAAAGDMVLKSASAKYKYKDASPSAAQQKCKLAGKCPTMLADFGPVSGFTVALGSFEMAGTEQYTHMFTVDDADKGGRNLDRVKVDLANAAATRAGGPGAAAGKFKAKIKNGELSFMYVVKDAARLGKLVLTGSHETVRAHMATSKPIKTTVTGEAGLEVHGTTRGLPPLEEHSGQGTLKFKATKTQGKVKLQK